MCYCFDPSSRSKTNSFLLFLEHGALQIKLKQSSVLATKPDLLDLRRPSHVCLIQCFIWNSLTGTQSNSSFCNRTFIFNFLVIDDFIIDVLNILPVSVLFILESFQVLESDVHEVNKKIQIEDCTRVYCFLLHRISEKFYGWNWGARQFRHNNEYMWSKNPRP